METIVLLRHSRYMRCSSTCWSYCCPSVTATVRRTEIRRQNYTCSIFNAYLRDVLVENVKQHADFMRSAYLPKKLVGLRVDVPNVMEILAGHVKLFHVMLLQPEL
jgi:hypothetical protein